MRYVTFGQGHRHEINGVAFDKDCIALIDGDREDVFKIFGRQWCFEYTEDEFVGLFGFKRSYLTYFPRGIIRLETQ